MYECVSLQMTLVYTHICIKYTTVSIWWGEGYVSCSGFNVSSSVQRCMTPAAGNNGQSRLIPSGVLSLL